MWSAGRFLKSKGPYDISIQLSQNSYAGISCKVKRLKPSNIERRKRLYLEVSNKNSATRVCVGGSERFVLPDNPRDAFAIGEKLIECIESEYGINAGRKYNYDINRLGLVLMHWNIDDSGKFWFTLYNWRGPFRIFDTIVHWVCSNKSLKGFADKEGRDLVLEWYPSGGHIKYYPHLDTVSWQSEQMCLEEIEETLPEFLIERVFSKFGLRIHLPTDHIPHLSYPWKHRGLAGGPRVSDPWFEN